MFLHRTYLIASTEHSLLSHRLVEELSVHFSITSVETALLILMVTVSLIEEMLVQISQDLKSSKDVLIVMVMVS